MDEPTTAAPQARHRAYARVAADDRFAELRRRHLRFAGPALIVFMIWYVAYVICNNWARDFMATPVIGHVNVALIFGLLQFVSTFAIAYAYARHARKRLDPLADELRTEFEAEVEADADHAPGRDR